MTLNNSEKPAPQSRELDQELAKLKFDVEAINYDKSIPFEENMDRRLRFYAQKVEEILKKDNQLGQVGEQEMNAMVTRQVEALRQIYLAKLNEFEGLMASQRHERAKNIFETAENDAAKYFNQLSGLSTKVLGDKPLQAEDAAHLKAVLQGVSQLRKDPATVKIFDKLTAQQDLQDEDFKQVVNLINPAEINAKNKEENNASKSFEASQVGTILAVMKPADRVKTLEYVAKLKPQEAVSIIEALAASSVVSITQVQDLLEKNLLPANAKAELQQKVQSGDLAKMRQIADENMKKRSRQFSNNFASNVMNVIVGKPLLYGVGAVWGSAVMLANVAADFDLSPYRNKQDATMGDLVDNLGTIAGNLATNPYFVGSGLLTAYSTNKLAPHIGGMFPEVKNVKDKAVETARDIFGSPTLSPKEQMEYDRHQTNLLWRNLRNNISLQNFLLEGKKGETGFDLLAKIHGEKIKQLQNQKDLPKEEKTSPILTYQDILSDKTITPRQKELLTQALNANINPVFFNSELNIILSATNNLKIQDGEQFKNLYQLMKKQEDGTN